jgi:DNA-binding response OmpR family regulator
MPKMNGFAFRTALDELAHARRVPVVFLTTSGFARDVEHARDAGACGYIVKPESFDELRRRVDVAIKQAISGKWS